MLSVAFFWQIGKLSLAPETKPSNYGILWVYANILSRMKAIQSGCLVSASRPTAAIPLLFPVAGTSWSRYGTWQIVSWRPITSGHTGYLEHCDRLSQMDPSVLLEARMGRLGVVGPQWRQAPLHTRWWGHHQRPVPVVPTATGSVLPRVLASRSGTWGQDHCRWTEARSYQYQQ